MSSNLYLAILCLSISNALLGQVCWECGQDFQYEFNPQFWMDPDGLTYPADDIWEPNKNGTWTFYELIDNTTIKVLFTREMQCDGVVYRSLPKEKIALRVYPNPASSIINLTHEFESCIVEIIDIGGKKIMREELKNVFTKSIDISHLPNGMYTLFLTTASEQLTTKLFVE